MSSGKPLHLLPLTAGFGVTREALWRVFVTEQAVKPAWALTLLSEYRLLQLSRYFVGGVSVVLEPTPVNMQTAVSSEFVRNVLQQHFYNLEDVKATYEYRAPYEERRYMLEENERKIYYLLSDIIVSLEAMSGPPNRLYWLVKAYYEGQVEKMIRPQEVEMFGRPDPNPNVAEKDVVLGIIDYSSDKVCFRFIKPQEKNYPVKPPEPNKTFKSVVELADFFDKYVGAKTKMYEIVRFSKKWTEKPKPPSYEEVSEEAGELVKMLAHLGAKVEYVLSFLALNGYKIGVTGQLEVPTEEKKYLETLLDEPFKRAAIVMAYGRVGDIKQLIRRLNREAFTYTTAVPRAYLESRPDIRKVLG